MKVRIHSGFLFYVLVLLILGLWTAISAAQVRQNCSIELTGSGYTDCYPVNLQAGETVIIQCEKCVLTSSLFGSVWADGYEVYDPSGARVDTNRGQFTASRSGNYKITAQYAFFSESSYSYTNPIDTECTNSTTGVQCRGTGGDTVAESIRTDYTDTLIIEITITNRQPVPTSSSSASTTSTSSLNTASNNPFSNVSTQTIVVVVTVIILVILILTIPILRRFFTNRYTILLTSVAAIGFFIFQNSAWLENQWESYNLSNSMTATRAHILANSTATAVQATQRAANQQATDTINMTATRAQILANATVAARNLANSQATNAAATATLQASFDTEFVTRLGTTNFEILHTGRVKIFQEANVDDLGISIIDMQVFVIISLDDIQLLGNKTSDQFLDEYFEESRDNNGSSTILHYENISYSVGEAYGGLSVIGGVTVDDYIIPFSYLAATESDSNIILELLTNIRKIEN